MSYEENTQVIWIPEKEMFEYKNSLKSLYSRTDEIYEITDSSNS
jgi:hypothetical protein